ncbi:MAG: ATP-grasp family protein [Methylophaga sp.]|uniref:GAK system ATP-grasp enzyme n=1 Tax=Methylophaga sp. UBA678 TaxID=1946901 RepID=UPI000C53616F|nr:GAK system ATP-grasp enzyme [Methylophaga sp. UBA678]MAX53666.1 ATP-grasp family protein [Methylophaga sp.]
MSNDLKVGVIGIPGKWSTETLADAVQAKTGYRLVIDMSEVTLDLTRMQLMYRGTNLCELDGLIVKKISAEYSPSTLDRLEMLRVAEQQGVRVFSRVESMLRLIDRLSCTITLKNAGIPMPNTCITEDVEQAINTVKQYGEAVFKPLFSTKARGMTLINAKQADSQIRQQVSDFKQVNPVMYIQQKLNLSGQDLGLVFLAGNYLGTYARVSQSDAWNTTIHSGGRYAAFEPSSEIIELATQAQSLFNMDFTTVDVAITDNGPIVFEVSAFGGFRGAKEGCEVDAAALYVEHVLETIDSHDE